jgi:indolepyruvate ferredoxin oxidoreductase beta subunit
MKEKNMLMVGVGGQGVIMASDATSEIGMKSGYDVKKSDTLGMAQRGGSVVSHVRWGKKVFSPMIKKGEVDFLIGFEQLEVARYIPYLKSGGIAMVADVTIIPVSVIGSIIPYPSWKMIEEMLYQYTDEVYLVPANRIIAEVGNTRVINMIMLGFLSTFLNLDTEIWVDNIRHRLRSQIVESNLEAFYKGEAEARNLTVQKEINKNSKKD